MSTQMDTIAENEVQYAFDDDDIICNEYIEQFDLEVSPDEHEQKEEYLTKTYAANVERTWQNSEFNPSRLSTFTPLVSRGAIRPRSIVKTDRDKWITNSKKSNQPNNVSKSPQRQHISKGVQQPINNRLSGKVARRRVSYQNSMLDRRESQNVNKNPAMMRRNAVSVIMPNVQKSSMKTQKVIPEGKEPKFRKSRSETQIIDSNKKQVVTKQLSTPDLLKSGRSQKLTISAPVVGSLMASHGIGIPTINEESESPTDKVFTSTNKLNRRSKTSKSLKKRHTSEMLQKTGKLCISLPVAGSFTSSHAIAPNVSAMPSSTASKPTENFRTTRFVTKPIQISKALSSSEILNSPTRTQRPLKLTISSPVPGSFAVTARIDQRFPQKLEQSRVSPIRKNFKSVVLNGEKCEWFPKGKCVWINMSGQHVKLTNVDLLSLSEIECIALQKVASQTLHDMDLGVSITIPKDESKLINGKNSLLHLHFSTKASRTKAKKHDHVFAIPLVRVVENDQLLRLQTIEQDSSSTSYSNANDVIQDASDSDSLIPSSLGASPKAGRRIPVSPSDQQANLKNVPTSGSPGSDDVDSAFSASPTTSSPRNTTNTVMPVNRTMRRRHAINTGIDEDESQLLKSLSETSTKDKKRSDLIPSTMPQVPYVVQKCCAHIIKHGLDVTGIFRVPGSKKRVKQLREEFDRGVDVRVEDDYLAHDVAALLKEFFRDLPEALLTRELYQAFISTTKLNHADRLSALRCLVWLLPMPNRDTFQQLLSFLATVAEYSEDKTDTNGNTVCGNKMGIPNLSMIFGPNILHRNKKTSSSSNDAQYQVQSLERAEESTLVISVVEDMIRNHKDLFMVPKETHDEILHTLQETDPHALDVLLRRKAVNYSRIETPQSSSEHTSDCGSSDDECTTTIFPVVNNINGNINNNNNNNSKGEYLTFQQHHERDRLETNSDKQRNSDILLDEESEHKDYEDDVDATLEDEISFNHQTRSISFTEDEIQDILLGDVKINKNSEKSINLKRETRNTTLGDITEVVTSNLAVTDATKVEEPVKVPTPLPRRKRTPQTVNSIQNDVIDSETQTKQSPLNEATNEQMSEKIPQNATPKPLKRRTRSATDQEKIHENHPNNVTSQITENTHNRNQKVERLAYVTQVTEQTSRSKFEWRIPNSSEQTGYSRRKGFSVQPEPQSPPQMDVISPAKTKSIHAERKSHIIDDDSTSGIADCDMSFSDSRSVEDLIKESRLILDKIPSHKARHPCHETPHATELHRDHDTTEPHVRKRPSALNLRMNRIYGTENSRVLHSVRIPKRASGDKDSRAGSSFHHGAGGRRFSKDDMFFTLEGQKLRNGRHLYINI